MKDLLKRIKADTILTAVLYIVLGVFLIIWSDKAVVLLGRIVAIILIVVGLVNMIHYIAERDSKHAYASSLGIIALLVGIWLFIKPASAAMLIPIILGVIMLIDGVQDLRMAMEARANNGSRWGASLAMGIFSMLFGVLCILNAFGVVKLVFKVIGVMLVYNGISDLIIVVKTVRAVKEYSQEQNAVDSDFHEV